MNCLKCQAEVTVKGDQKEGTMYYETVDPLLDSNKAKHPVPFYCDVCGAIKFPFRPTGDKVFVVSDPIETHIGMIEIPEQYRKEKRRTGTVVAIGRGYYNDKGKFIATSVQVGQRVIYHKNVPWKMKVVGQDGNEHRVEYMGERDIQFVLDSDFDEKTID